MIKRPPNHELRELTSALVELKLYLLAARIRQAVVKYRPDQARVPRGSPDGGQWIDEGRARVAGKWNDKRREDCELQYEKDILQCRMMPWNPFCENQAMVRLVACMKGDDIPPFFHAM